MEFLNNHKHGHYRKLLFFLILGFFVGIVLVTNRVVPSWSMFFIIFWTLVGLILARCHQNSRVWLLIFSSFCLGLFLGFGRGEAMAKFNYGTCTEFENNFSGLVVSEPIVAEFNQRLIVRPDRQDFNILLFVDREDDWRYGDRINFQGRLQEPKNFQTDAGEEFSYRNYLLKDNILCLGRGGEAVILSRGGGSHIKQGLFAVKKEFLATINRYLPEPRASLLSGILLGAQSSLPKAVSEDYRRAGLTHILVLSGQNISIIASVMMIVFGWLGPAVSFFLVVFGLVLFALMAGAGASVVRAALMGSLVVLARATGRPYSGGLALIFAGAAMVWFNPRLLVFDLGFQLSFLATLGLFYGTPFMMKVFKFLPTGFGVREITSISAAAILFTSPWLAYSFGQLSIVALPANILVVPTVELTMLFGFMMVVFGWFHLPLAWPVAWLSGWLLIWNLKMTQFFASWSLAVIAIKNFSLVFVVGSYLIIFWLIVYDRKHPLNEAKSIEL